MFRFAGTRIAWAQLHSTICRQGRRLRALLNSGLPDLEVRLGAIPLALLPRGGARPCRSLLAPSVLGAGTSCGSPLGLPAHLTPRAREVLQLVVNSVALGTHDDDAEIGALAKTIGTTPGRLQSVLKKLVQQGLVTINRDFVYPTVAGLRWQNPKVSEREAKAVLKKLR